MNHTAMLDHSIESFNRRHKVKLEYDSRKGGLIKGLKIINDDYKFLDISKSLAWDIIDFIDYFLDLGPRIRDQVRASNLKS